MKKILNLSLALLFLFSANSIFAQRGQRSQNIDELKSQLNLSAEQVAAFEKIESENELKLKTIKEDESMSKEDKRASFMEIRKSQKAATEGLLNEEQKSKLSELKQEKRKVQKMKHKESADQRKQKVEKTRTLRAEFDQKIEAEDREKIAELRTIFKQEKKASKNDYKGGMKKDLTEENKLKMREDMKEKRTQFRAEHKTEIEELKKLSEKYAPEIKSFMQEKGVSSDQKIRKGKEKKTKAEKGQLKNKSKHNGRKGHKRSQGDKASRFLLMDFEQSGQGASSKESEVKIFPNPSSSWTNVEYNVRVSGDVKVMVKDEQGNTVQTLVNQKVEKGSYTIEFNSSALSNKNYFIVVSDGQGTTSKSFIIMK